MGPKGAVFADPPSCLMGGGLLSSMQDVFVLGVSGWLGAGSWGACFLGDEQATPGASKQYADCGA